jgi:NADPH-dependent 2,4-dienoyl-CoA reductase/sulfur reductase-like enzyme
VGLTAGVSPNLDLLRGTAVRTARGVLVDRALRTSVADVYAAGDCAEIEFPGGANLLQQVWYTGKRQGELVAEVMSGEERAYEPGIWFNSAKFFDLEYQVYGAVNRDLPGAESLYWEDPRGRRAVRIVHVGGVVVGFNLMGVRWRHAVCERWIAERQRLADVLPRLSEAGFDPEFGPHVERAVAAAAGMGAG